MSYRPKIELKATVPIVLFGIFLTGCSEPGLYLDRRDSIALGAGDAIEANKVAQVVDPWPPQSGNTNLTYNGQRMQAAVERYRTGNTAQPANSTNMQVASPLPLAVQSIGPSTTSGGSNAAPTTSANTSQ